MTSYEIYYVSDPLFSKEEESYIRCEHSRKYSWTLTETFPNTHGNIPEHSQKHSWTLTETFLNTHRNIPKH